MARYNHKLYFPMVILALALSLVSGECNAIFTGIGLLVLKVGARSNTHMNNNEVLTICCSFIYVCKSVMYSNQLISNEEHAKYVASLVCIIDNNHCNLEPCGVWNLLAYTKVIFTSCFSCFCGRKWTLFK